MIHQQIEDEYLGEKREFSTPEKKSSEKKRNDHKNGFSYHHQIQNHDQNNNFHQKLTFDEHQLHEKNTGYDQYDPHHDHTKSNSFESDRSKGDSDFLIEEGANYQDHIVNDIESGGSFSNKKLNQDSENLQKAISKVALQVPHTSQRDQYLNEKDIKLLSFLLFCINFGFSIEVVFISPFFFKVNTPDILDTLIWLVPPLLEKLIFPIVSIPLKKKSVSMLKYRKLFILLFCALSIAGLFLMGFSRYITANWVNIFEDTKKSIMVLGIFGFVFQDIGHDMILLIVNQYASDSVRDEDQDECEYQFSFASSLGKIFAFLISSVLAFNFEVWDVQNFMENLTFSYSIGAILLLCGFLKSFRGLRTNQMKISQQFTSESISPVYTLNTMLPSIIELQNMPRQQKLLVISHFLMCGNLLLINIYATLWMGVTLQHSNQRYNIEQSKQRDYLFDLGISWGALVLCISAFLYFFTTRYIQKLKNSKNHKVFLFATNFALNLSFIYTFFTNNFYSSCLSLLLFGMAQASFDSIPSKLCSHLEFHHKICCRVSSELLDISLFFCQILFWFIMPGIFLLFSGFIDDISFSLIQGSIFGLIGSILVLFVY